MPPGVISPLTTGLATATMVMPMHIVLLNDDALPSARGGAAVVVEHLRRSYRKLGHEVTLVTVHGEEGGIREENDGIGRIFAVPARYDRRRRHRHCVSPSAPVLGRIAAVLRECKPDAVHAHNLHEFLTYGALRAARAHTERLILTAHDTFLVSFGRVRGPAFEGDTLAGRPHRMRLREHFEAAGRRYWPLRNYLIRKILHETGTQVISISDALRDFLNANGIPETVTIHNGTEVLPPVPDTEVAAFRKEKKLNDMVILYGGRMSEDKGSAALLAAFCQVRKRCPQAQLLLAGDPERITPLLERLPTEEREGMVPAGWLTREQMRLAYAASTVATTPSLYLDPFNLMNIEAMAEGVPVVGTCFGGTPEIIVDGETGFVINPRDTTGFAKHLITLLQDRGKAREMGERGRQRVQDNFSIDAQTTAYLDLFHEPKRGFVCGEQSRTTNPCC